jgi:hypothetical protein
VSFSPVDIVTQSDNTNGDEGKDYYKNAYNCAADPKHWALWNLSAFVLSSADRFRGNGPSWAFATVQKPKASTTSVGSGNFQYAENAIGRSPPARAAYDNSCSSAGINYITIRQWHNDFASGAVGAPDFFRCVGFSIVEIGARVYREPYRHRSFHYDVVRHHRAIREPGRPRLVASKPSESEGIYFEDVHRTPI